MPADALLEAAVAAVSQALANAPDGRVAGLGVTSMAESGVLLDARGRPVVPVIAWHDARDLPQVTQFGRDIGADRFSTRTGLPLRSQWSMTKHRWQLETDPRRPEESAGSAWPNGWSKAWVATRPATYRWPRGPAGST